MITTSVRAGFVTVALVLGGLAATPAQADDLPTDECPAGYRADFNGDGFADSVVADPYATVAGHTQAGRLVVLYGDADGRVGEGAREVLTQGADAIGGGPETGDRFGFALSVADIDCDGFTDVVVGTPYEDLGSTVDSGWVQIVWGAASGLGTGGVARGVSKRDFGAPIRANDQFGYAVDTQEDWTDGATGAPNAYVLAIGSPGSDVNGHDDAGWVGVETAVDGGSNRFSVTQDTPGVAGAAEAGDRFGAAVAVGQFRGATGTIDVAVGSPNEDVGSVTDAGSVTIVQDIYDEPTGAAYDQNSPGVPGVAEAGDRFGRSLADIRVASTSHLAVGVPGEDIGSARNAGSVQLFTATGVPLNTLSPRTGLTQNTAGVSGVAESGDLFGDRLAFAPPTTGDRVTRLVVGVPGEDAAAADSGLVQVFPITNLDDETTLRQDSSGVPGAVDAGDRFGASLAVVTGPTEKALLVGVPDDVDHPGGMVNVIPFSGGFERRAWVPGQGGVPAGGSRFGATLASAGR
ncbi:hypothetical protein GCM10009841_02540 [Microlunatus panaciterrae]|uniref:FG-GAP repeat-containing protein n=1 Tax=Microlunatus panaciterrae TaxID=400768 RepID=A0ABS2RJD3_9ACTN|nr:VCBS repeat-containing protein [Microlunatus panaciterrae]MBM7799082.1 hypothetical protein [Microlunatus panaciterrae]